ncbi:MAG: hypothetical protein AAGK47_03035, partial [Bacteroidota bacterium]
LFTKANSSNSLKFNLSIGLFSLFNAREERQYIGCSAMNKKEMDNEDKTYLCNSYKQSVCISIAQVATA